MKEKIKAFFIPLIAIILLLFLLIPMNVYRRGERREKRSIKIAVFLYKADDVFISNLNKQVEKYAKEFENQNNIKINIEVLDAARDQGLQNRQIERYISLDYDAFLVNPVDRTNVSGIIDLCMKNNVPLIFFNRKPATDDMNRYDKVYYVGTDPKEEAIKQGELLLDLYENNAKALDLNGDGKISYVLLEGEASHQDSLIRTKWTVKTLQDKAVPISKLAGGVANWDSSQSAALMEEWLEEYKGEIELVISNNDAMALGAIEAIEQKKDIRGIKVVGIDGITDAIDKIKQKKMYGTVANEIESYAQTIVDIAVYSAKNDNFPAYISAALVDGKYIYIKQKAITIDNIN